MKIIISHYIIQDELTELELEDMPFNFFQNKECEYYPCHKVKESEKVNFNCLFCFCPLYGMKDCGGGYEILANGLKDCTSCMIPHFNYEYIIEKLIKDK